MIGSNCQKKRDAQGQERDRRIRKRADLWSAMTQYTVHKPAFRWGTWFKSISSAERVVGDLGGGRSLKGQKPRR